jgi:hypothetical protein
MEISNSRLGRKCKKKRKEVEFVFALAVNYRL